MGTDLGFVLGRVVAFTGALREEDFDFASTKQNDMSIHREGIE
jgi:hypothetical protein